MYDGHMPLNESVNCLKNAVYMCDCELCNDYLHDDLIVSKDNVLVNETCDSANTSIWSVETCASADTSVWSTDGSFSSVSSLSDCSNLDVSVCGVNATVCRVSNDSSSEPDNGYVDGGVVDGSELDDFYNSMFEDVNLNIDDCFYEKYESVDDVVEDDFYVYCGDVHY